MRFPILFYFFFSKRREKRGSARLLDRVPGWEAANFPEGARREPPPPGSAASPHPPAKLAAPQAQSYLLLSCSSRSRAAACS